MKNFRGLNLKILLKLKYLVPQSTSSGHDLIESNTVSSAQEVSDVSRGMVVKFSISWRKKY